MEAPHEAGDRERGHERHGRGEVVAEADLADREAERYEGPHEQESLRGSPLACRLQDEEDDPDHAEERARSELVPHRREREATRQEEERAGFADRARGGRRLEAPDERQELAEPEWCEESDEQDDDHRRGRSGEEKGEPALAPDFQRARRGGHAVDGGGSHREHGRREQHPRPGHEGQHEDEGHAERRPQRRPRRGDVDLAGVIAQRLHRGPQDEDEGEQDTAGPGEEIGAEPEAGDDAPARPRAPRGLESRGQGREDEERQQALRHVVVRVAEERSLEELAGQESHDRRREKASGRAEEPPSERKDRQRDEGTEDRGCPGEHAVHERGRGRAFSQRPRRRGEG